MATYYRYTNSGLTILELLVVLSIGLLLATGVVASLSSFQGKRIVGNEAQNIATLVERAATLTQSSRDDAVYGIHFEATKVVLFKGDTYVGGLSSDEEVVLNTRVTLATINLTGGGSDMLFQRINGGTAEYGTTTVALISDVTVSKDIVVNASGLVEVL